MDIKNSRLKLGVTQRELAETADRVHGIAIRIRCTTHRLDIAGTTADGLTIRDCKRCGNADGYEFLAVVDDDDSGYGLYDINGSGCLHNDYSRCIDGATNKQALAFLNRVRKTSECLGGKEAGKTKRLKQAVADTADS